MARTVRYICSCCSLYARATSCRITNTHVHSSTKVKRDCHKLDEYGCYLIIILMWHILEQFKSVCSHKLQMVFGRARASCRFPACGRFFFVFYCPDDEVKWQFASDASPTLLGSTMISSCQPCGPKCFVLVGVRMWWLWWWLIFIGASRDDTCPG